jgi:hypothetical protein
MQKLKKALKNLTKLGKSPAPKAAAKKPSSVKKKSAPVAKTASKKATPMKKKIEAKPAAKKASSPAVDKNKKKPATPTITRKADPKVITKKAAPVAKTEAKDASKVAGKKELGTKASIAKPTKETAAKDAAKDKAGKKAQGAKAESFAEVETAPEVAQPKALAAAAPDEAYNDADDVVLTDAEGRRYCRVKECDQLATVDNYCRYHYLLLWKNIQVRKKILTEGKLGRYIEELTARYPDKYLEILKKDLRTEKDFTAAIQELEIDDTNVDNEYEDEAQSFIEEVRGMSGDTPQREEEDF